MDRGPDERRVDARRARHDAGPLRRRRQQQDLPAKPTGDRDRELKTQDLLLLVSSFKFKSICGADKWNEKFTPSRQFQYSFDITALTDTVLVCLDQEDVSAGKQTGAKHLEIGFSIWQVGLYFCWRVASAE